MSFAGCILEDGIRGLERDSSDNSLNGLIAGL